MTDPELDRTLLDAARDEMGPSEAQQKRLLERTMLAVGGAVASGAVSSGAAAASAAVTGAGGAAVGGAATGGVVVAGTTVAVWKLATIAIVGLVAVGGTAWGVSQRSETAPASAASAETGPESSAAQPRHELRAAPEPIAAPEPTEAPEPTAAPAPMAASPAPEAASSAERSAPEPAASPSTTPRREVGAAMAAVQEGGERVATPAGLGAEAALLRSAHRALQAGQPAEALRLLDEHRAAFPNGALSQEQTATRVLALCEAGRAPEARRVADGFLARHPDSMQASRIRSSCAGSP